MKHYTKLLVLTLLCLLALPFAASASNDAEGALLSDNATIQGEYESNNDGHYLDNDDDGEDNDDDGEDNDDDGEDNDDDGEDNDDDGEDNDDDGEDSDDDDINGEDNDDDGEDNDDDDINGEDNDDDGEDNDDDGEEDEDNDDDGEEGEDNDDDDINGDNDDDNSADDARSNSGTTPAASSRTSTSSSSSASNNCQTFSETGYTVCDDSSARFMSAFQSYGLQNIGYPISARFSRDGFITQGFQKAVLQWRADSNSVAFVNVFDELHNNGMDGKLQQTWQTPAPLPAGWDGNVSFPEVVQKRQALLTRSALHQAYFSAADPLTFYGLPTSAVQDMGNHYAIRLQRAVLQEWKEDVPWAKAGQVTIANGGDIAKQLGYLPQ